MASIWLSRFQVIPFFTVQRDVEAFDFVLFADAQSGHDVDNFQDRDGSDKGKDPGEQDSDYLISNLAPVAIQAAHGFPVAEDGINDNACAHSGEDCSNGAARPVNSEGVERVVVAEQGFKLCNHPVAEDTGNEPNSQSRARADESGSGGDGDEPGHGSGDRAERTRSSVLDPFCKAPTNRSGCGPEVSGDKRA